jgi:hypothetical protein
MSPKTKQWVASALVGFSVLTSSPAVRLLDWIGRVFDTVELVHFSSGVLDMLEPRDLANLVILIVGLCIWFEYNPIASLRAKVAGEDGEWEPTEQQIREECLAHGNPLSKPHLEEARDHLIMARHFNELTAHERVDQVDTPAALPAPDLEAENAPPINYSEVYNPWKDGAHGTDDLGYRWPKAVLKAEIPKGSVTKEAQAANQPPHKVTALMGIKNDHTSDLRDCSALLVGLSYNGNWKSVNKVLRAGTKGIFNVASRAPYRFTFLSRNISDTVTPEPFHLNLEGDKCVLDESTTYLAVLSLRSPYKWPTLVTLQIKTGLGVDVSVKVLDQRLPDGVELL